MQIIHFQCFKVATFQMYFVKIYKMTFSQINYKYLNIILYVSHSKAFKPLDICAGLPKRMRLDSSNITISSIHYVVCLECGLKMAYLKIRQRK